MQDIQHSFANGEDSCFVGHPLLSLIKTSKDEKIFKNLLALMSFRPPFELYSSMLGHLLYTCAELDCSAGIVLYVCPETII